MNEQQLSEFRERGAIEGFLSGWLSDKVSEQYGLISLGSDYFRPLYLEEAQELGYGDDEPEILLRRESDGKVFEVTIDASVRAVPMTEAERVEAAGQLRLPGGAGVSRAEDPMIAIAEGEVPA